MDQIMDSKKRWQYRFHDNAKPTHLQTIYINYPQRISNVAVLQRRVEEYMNGLFFGMQAWHTSGSLTVKVLVYVCVRAGAVPALYPVGRSFCCTASLSIEEMSYQNPIIKLSCIGFLSTHLFFVKLIHSINYFTYLSTVIYIYFKTFDCPAAE